jgi:cysteine desulfurase
MKEMKKYSTGEYTNPSSLYLSGVKTKKAIEEARSQVAQVLHAHPDEIYFTHGGTHGNELVLNDKKLGDKRKIIISAIEHSSITNLVEAIRVPVDSSGLINVDFFKKNLTTDTFIVSIMLVNNEIGVIEPIHQIVKIVRDFNKVNNTKILENYYNNL